MQEKIKQLRQLIIQIAESDLPPLNNNVIRPEFLHRPAFFLAPHSYAGMVHGENIAKKMTNVIASIDDQNTNLGSIHGVPRWGSDHFLAKVKQYPDAVAIDFSCSLNGREFVENICKIAGIDRVAIKPADEPLIRDFDRRPIFLIHPQSGVGKMHISNIVSYSNNIVAAVEDGLIKSASIPGVAVWSAQKFREHARSHPNAIAVDFSYDPGQYGLTREWCRDAGVERISAAKAAAHCGLAAVYEPARVYRQRTLLRLDEFLNLANRMEDEFSVFTLYSNLLFRLTYDPSYLLSAWATPASEYFSAFADNSTFQLGRREHFCDGGAFQGGIVQKFLDASQYQYESVTAFEPDAINFQKLQKLTQATPRAEAVKMAISNENANLRFHETGTVSSHVSPEGGVAVSTMRLDDKLEKLTLLKLDIEGFEARALQGASQIIKSQRPRMAICVYHYANDLLDVFEQLDNLVDGYHFRLRQHSCGYYYDLVLYASPVAGTQPPPWAQ